MVCRHLRPASFALAGLGLLMAAALAAPRAMAATIKVDGSSTVYPITDAVAAEFKRSRGSAISLTVGISGIGGGFRKFCRGETDISNASRPILATEITVCRAASVDYLELPVAFDALTVVVNTKNSFLRSITVDELKRLWEPAAQGRIMRWNQLNAAWPDTSIKLFGPGADSGTFDYFTEAIVGAAKASRLDYIASEDDNVLVQGVARDTNALGYFGYAYYVANRQKLRALSIAGRSGNPAVEPSLEAVVRGSYQPLSRPIFIYVNAQSLGRAEVLDFVQFYLKNGVRFALGEKYVPLPGSAYAMVLEHVRLMRKGTVFSGSPEVGMTIEELLTREAKP